MNIEDFVKDVLVSLDKAVEEATKETAREVWLRTGSSDKRTVEFDMAVTVEEHKGAKGKAGVRVIGFVDGGGELSKANISSTVSRIQLGIDFNSNTREEQDRQQAIFVSKQASRNRWPDQY